jgi:Zn-dependent protease
MATQRESSWFENFMASNYGRVARAMFGIALLAFGLALIGGTVGLIVAGFGLVPIAAGVFNLCPVAPLWGGHFLGSRYCSRDLRR